MIKPCNFDALVLRKGKERLAYDNSLPAPGPVKACIFKFLVRIHLRYLVPVEDTFLDGSETAKSEGTNWRVCGQAYSHL